MKNIKVSTTPVHIVSVIQLVSKTNGCMPQHQGVPMMKYYIHAIFIGNYSDFTCVYIYSIKIWVYIQQSKLWLQLKSFLCLIDLSSINIIMITVFFIPSPSITWLLHKIKRYTSVDLIFTTKWQIQKKYQVYCHQYNKFIT